MKELHIKVGDIKRFLHQIQHALKKKKLIRKVESNIGSLYSLPVILDERIPKNRAVLLDKDNRVIQIYNL